MATLGCPSDDSTTIKLYINYTKRLRDEVGAKFQTVIFNLDSNEKLADYEGVIEIGSKVTDYDSGISGLGQYGLVYWMTGASAGCAVNKSNTNKKYDGELTVDVDRTQAELEAAIKAGRLMFHNVNGDVRILEDIDSLITVSDTKGDVFKSNQTTKSGRTATKSSQNPGSFARSLFLLNTVKYNCQLENTGNYKGGKHNERHEHYR